MTILKIAPLAAAALTLLVFASQANAAPYDDANDANVVYARSNTSAYDSTYRNPTTREALDEGAW